jgi:hypothetical protein
MAASAAALLAGCVPQSAPTVGLQQDAELHRSGETSKVDAEVKRIFAVAGLDPDDPQKAKAVDRQSVGTVLAVRSGGRKVGMAVARLGRDQIMLQDPDAVARLVPGADPEKLSRSLAGVLPTSGAVQGARLSFDRRHLALEIEADGSSAPTSLMAAAPLSASRFVPSGRVGERIPPEVVASIRAGGEIGQPKETAIREDLAVGLPEPTAVQAKPAERSVFTSLFDTRTPIAAAPMPVASAAAAVPPAVEQPRIAPTPPPPTTYASGPPVVTVEDEFYAAPPRKAAQALAYAPAVQAPRAAAPAAYVPPILAEPNYDLPAGPTVRRW